MIDIFGRVGKLDEVMEFLNIMLYEVNGVVWGVVFGVVRIYKNVELG